MNPKYYSSHVAGKSLTESTTSARYTYKYLPRVSCLGEFLKIKGGDVPQRMHQLPVQQSLPIIPQLRWLGEPWRRNAMEKLELGAWKNRGYRMRATEYSTGSCSIKISLEI